MTSNPVLKHAVRIGMFAGAASAAGAYTQPALAANEAGASDELQEVVVTGSRIRRVDAETASPVFVIDQEAITNSGVTTLGDLIQRIPSISGAATNPTLNNGGGDGDSNIELRGLDVSRTLVLLNGRRVGASGFSTGAVDVNILPVALIERVEVLKEGAGAVYGSDAIAGVVNFITKQEFDGIEFNYRNGVTDHSDGRSNKIELTMGATGERGSVIFDASYEKQQLISAANRDWSKVALTFYGSVFEGGSSRAPNGRITLPDSVLANYGGADGCPSKSVIRIEGRPGTSLEDFRCFITTPGPGETSDFYNFQSTNIIVTPQDRATMYTAGKYEINDSIEAYGEVLYNRTHSGFAIAPLTFNARADNVLISADSIYNPFGIDFGSLTPIDDEGTLNTDAAFRMVALGQRRNDVVTQTSQVNTGIRGKFGSSTWRYDATLSYGHMDQDTKTSGYLFQPALANAFGPSFLDGDGVPRCGTPDAIIAGCTPVNIFNLTGEGQAAALQGISAAYQDNYVYRTKAFTLNFDGDLFQLPAGAVKAAVGYDYMDLGSSFDTDFLTTAEPPLFQTCKLAQDTCTTDSKGDYHVNEVYAEFFVPVLKDLPGVKALNVTAGVRYSDYSLFGEATKSTFKVEYRPIDDLLIRAGFSQVFRVPSIYNLYHGTIADAPTFNDPCVGLTQAQVDANPNFALLCVNVPRDGTFEQPDSQVSGQKRGNPDLQPEHGTVFTYGFVYDPSWLKNFTVSVDFWRYKLKGLITEIDPNTAAERCVETGQDLFCSQFLRFADGTINIAYEPFVNLGELETNGVDVGIAYAWRDTPVGDFRFTVDGTYTDSYKNTPSPGADAVEIAGTYDRQFGNYAKLRTTAAVGWAFKGFTGLLSARYIDSIVLHDPDAQPGIQPDLKIPSVTYVDLSLGYEFPTNTKIRIGGENLTNKEPPILYQNNVTNSNSDPSTYDFIGRRYWVSLSQKF